jgi:hypothetical protein
LSISTLYLNNSWWQQAYWYYVCQDQLPCLYFHFLCENTDHCYSMRNQTLLDEFILLWIPQTEGLETALCHLLIHLQLYPIWKFAHIYTNHFFFYPSYPHVFLLGTSIHFWHVVSFSNLSQDATLSLWTKLSHLL